MPWESRLLGSRRVSLTSFAFFLRKGGGVEDTVKTGGVGSDFSSSLGFRVAGVSTLHGLARDETSRNSGL